MHTLTISTITTSAPLRAIYDNIVTIEIPGMAWATFCGLVAEGGGDVLRELSLVYCELRKD